MRSSTSRSACACAAIARATGWSGGDSERCRACARPASSGRDGRARSAPCDRRASPCRSRAVRRSARHAACGRCGRLEQRAARPRHGRTGRSSRADAERSSISASVTCRSDGCRRGRSSGVDRSAPRWRRDVRGSRAEFAEQSIRRSSRCARRRRRSASPASIRTQRSGSRVRQARDRRRAASRGIRRSSASNRSACRVAAPLAPRAQGPTSAGTSRMKVRSGLVSPTVTRSSARISAASTLPQRPDRRGWNRRSGRRSPMLPRASAGRMVHAHDDRRARPRTASPRRRRRAASPRPRAARGG